MSRDFYQQGAFDDASLASMDIPSVASLLKMILRDMDEPLLTFGLYTPLIALAQHMSETCSFDGEGHAEQARGEQSTLHPGVVSGGCRLRTNRLHRGVLLKRLPPSHYECLQASKGRDR